MNVFLFMLGAAIVIEAMNDGKATRNIIHGHEPITPNDLKLELAEDLLRELDNYYTDLYNEETQENPSKQELDYINRQINIRERMIDKLLTKQ